MNKRKSTDLEKRVFAYLDEVRESGAINMFNAPPFVQKKFQLSESEAIDLTSRWMNNFNEDGDYNMIKEN